MKKDTRVSLKNLFISISDKNNSKKLLTRESEQELAYKVLSGDKAARELMIESNYKLAHSIAFKCYKRSRTKKIEFEDVLQESKTGLIKAVDRFNPSKGYKFSTYATWWIKQSAQQFISDNSSVIKIPNYSRILNAKAKRAIEDYKLNFGHTPTLKEISALLDVPEETIKTSVNIPTNYVYIDEEKDDDNQSGSVFTVQETSMNPEEQLLHEENIKSVVSIFNMLKPREEMIIRLRYGIQTSDNQSRFLLSEEEIKKIEQK